MGEVKQHPPTQIVLSPVKSCSNISHDAAGFAYACIPGVGVQRLKPGSAPAWVDLGRCTGLHGPGHRLAWEGCGVFSPSPPASTKTPVNWNQQVPWKSHMPCSLRFAGQDLAKATATAAVTPDGGRLYVDTTNDGIWEHTIGGEHMWGKAWLHVHGSLEWGRLGLSSCFQSPEERKVGSFPSGVQGKLSSAVPLHCTSLHPHPPHARSFIQTLHVLQLQAGLPATRGLWSLESWGRSGMQAGCLQLCCAQVGLKESPLCKLTGEKLG